MNKKELSERDITTKFVIPALTRAVSGWDLDRQIREEYTLTADRVTTKARAGHGARIPNTGKRADIVLFHKPNIPIAVIEVKDNNHAVGAGMQQALRYAELLGVPLAYSTNGDAFIESDLSGTSKTIERDIPIDRFPTPDELWRRYCAHRNITAAEEPVVAQDWHPDVEGKTPRYYQLKAVNQTVEAIAKGQQRVLLVMATGTGKTFTAFQIIWRLWKAHAKKRVLFLADRNVLVDQARNNDFQPLKEVFTKIEHRNVDKSFEMYFALYQAVTGVDEQKNIYKQFRPGFFDLVIVDECHRGSAAENSAWREILEYFSSATQIGMTATPKETETVSNIDYFGEPIFTYSLREGIEDGYLAPYKVIRIEIDKDVEGYKPGKDKLDKYGALVRDRLYQRKDFDRTLVIEPRTTLVAQKVTEYLKQTDRMAKTIVFCVDTEHASRMRTALIRENADIYGEKPQYIRQITGDEQDALDDFLLPSKPYPVIATTSKLLSTGVDTQTCKLIVIDQEIGSMSEFKQIVGRGTRVREDYGKLWFTIMDFRGATRHFADDRFDGPPEQIYEPKEGDPIAPPTERDTDAPPSPSAARRGGTLQKYYLPDVEVAVLRDSVQRIGYDGKVVEIPLEQHARDVLSVSCKTLGDLKERYFNPEERGELVAELERHGVRVGDLAEKLGEAYSTFNLLAHVGFGVPLLPRSERAARARVKALLSDQKELPRKVLAGLLEKFVAEGLEALDDAEQLKLPPFDELGTLVELVSAFGGRPKFEKTIAALQAALYDDA